MSAETLPPFLDPEWRSEDGMRWGEHRCMDCERVECEWAADADVWDTVMASNGGIGRICADCFLRRAHPMGVHLSLQRYCPDGET